MTPNPRTLETWLFQNSSLSSEECRGFIDSLSSHQIDTICDALASAFEAGKEKGDEEGYERGYADGELAQP